MCGSSDRGRARKKLGYGSGVQIPSSRTAEYVDFEAPSRPPLIESFNLPAFVCRIDMRWIDRHIPRADARWMGQLLRQLSPEQIRDALGAAGYSPKEVDEFATVAQRRIAEL